MMPYDHAASAYVLVFFLLKVLHPALNPEQLNHLLLWSLFWGVIVDWDMIISYSMLGSLKMSTRISHRRFPSHTPLPWLALSLVIYFVANTLYWKIFGLTILTSVIAHLLGDSIEIGIMWLWPFSNKQYSLLPFQDGEFFQNEKNLVTYYAKMYRQIYMRMGAFKVGLAMVAIALITLFI